MGVRPSDKPAVSAPSAAEQTSRHQADHLQTRTVILVGQAVRRNNQACGWDEGSVSGDRGRHRLDGAALRSRPAAVRLVRDHERQAEDHLRLARGELRPDRKRHPTSCASPTTPCASWPREIRIAVPRPVSLLSRRSRCATTAWRRQRPSSSARRSRRESGVGGIRVSDRRSRRHDTPQPRPAAHRRRCGGDEMLPERTR